ncbi:peptidoglycan D,D-transpeptidase FtsI family protein [Clostridium estertheticum]|uniref:peptidoglycan D,D-transpeptidase FtsI family protein n=1 Tax=Clostridium estertheticum TaxID=238834 RepID=UPI001CF3465C|nr:penicillin-binding transpeptidase domain-containing protein [Clostridium estertheticum]MCB2353297.1 penicillin-binding protein 2 [Clostridium estertheticum]WAG41647.1 penicillin-binding protein 2 [Clostridium estertheticum]
MNDFVSNIKKVLLVFLILFIALITYITYVYMFNSQKAVASTFNRRLWAERNKVLRGTIYDKDMVALTKSTKTSETSQKQNYLQGAAFAHAIGYMDPVYGLSGLEKKYDAQLMGNNDTTLSKFVFFNRDTEQKVGNGLRTTLDSKLQKKAYELLGDHRGSIVAMNPKTGEILAMVSTPSYDPNNLEKDWKSITTNKEMPLLNRAVSGLYPPGSTFKTVTAASALENIANVYNSSLNDNGSLIVNGTKLLEDYNGESFGNIDFKSAYMHSSNVFFGSLGLDLGNKALKDTAEKFYFNKNIPTIGLTIENSVFPDYKNNEKGNIAQSAIGQAGVLVTPMQMALVVSAVANGGTMMEPMLVKEILSSKGKSIEKLQPKQLGQVMTKNNSDIMKGLMKEVVSQGTGTSAALSGIVVSGKTGTADHDDPSKQEAPHAWFTGFAPYDDPQIAIAVIVEEGGQGGAKAAEITRELVRTYLQ